MRKKVKKSRLAKIPAWVLSLITFVVIILIVIFLEDPQSASFSTTEIIEWIFIIFLTSIACFIICMAHPKSVWYTPLICNAVGIIGLISNLYLTIVLTNYNTTSIEWIILLSSVVFSVIAAILGARIGGHRINQD